MAPIELVAGNQIGLWPVGSPVPAVTNSRAIILAQAATPPITAPPATVAPASFPLPVSLSPAVPVDPAAELAACVFRLEKQSRPVSEAWEAHGEKSFAAVAHCSTVWEADVPRLQALEQDELAAVFEDMVIRWLLENELGELDSDKHLNEILYYSIPRAPVLHPITEGDAVRDCPDPNYNLQPIKEASQFWLTKLAISLITSPANPDRLKILLRLLEEISARLKLTDPADAKEPHDQYKLILKYYESTTKDLPLDPLLHGEILLGLAATTKDQTAAAAFVARAQTDFQKIIDSANATLAETLKSKTKLSANALITKANNKLFEIVVRRVTYRKAGWALALSPADVSKTLVPVFNSYQPSALRLLAETYSRQADNLVADEARLEKLAAAMALLTKADALASGAEQQAIWLAMAETTFKAALLSNSRPDLLAWSRAVASEVSNYSSPSAWAGRTALAAKILRLKIDLVTGADIKTIESELSALSLTERQQLEFAEFAALRYFKLKDQDGNYPPFLAFAQTTLTTLTASPDQEIKTQARLWQGKLLVAEAERDVAKLAAAEKLLTEVAAEPEAQRALAEITARRAFLAKDLGQAWPLLLSAAKEKFLALVKPDSRALPYTKAEANLWLAKIILVEAGAAASSQARNDLLAQAISHLGTARASNTLSGASLSSLYQTFGEVAVARKDFQPAEEFFRQALQLHAKNYEARAALGDVLSWQGQHQAAIEVYQAGPSAQNRIKLGLAEARLRIDENYSKTNIQAMFEAARAVLTAEPKGSPLLARALDDLVEAFSTDADLQENILLVGSRALNFNLPFPLSAAPYNGLPALLDSLSAKGAVYPDYFRAALYLKVADALASTKVYNQEEQVWEKKYDEAEAFLDGIEEKLPAGFLAANPELAALSVLIKAEIKMRRDKTTIVFDTRDPDLIGRFVFDQIEGYTREKNFAQAAATAAQYFHLEKFKFRLRFKYAEALATEAVGRQADALKELAAIQADSTAAARVKAQAHLLAGEVYSYNWSGQNSAAAKTEYEAALAALKAITAENFSGAARLIKARALLGLANLFNYGEGLRDFKEAQKYYAAAHLVIGELPQRSDEREELEIKYYYGLGILYQQVNLSELAEENFLQARIIAGQSYDASFLDRSYQAVAEPHFKVDHHSYRDKVYYSGGENSSVESQTNVTLQAPLYGGRIAPYFRNQTDTRQGLDGASQVNTSYAGLKVKLRDKKLTLDGALKIPGSSQFLTADHQGLPLYYRRPDLTLSASYWERNWNTSAATTQDFSDSRLSTYYADVMYNFGRLIHPAFNLRLGPTVSYYHFLSAGGFKQRFDVGLGAAYEQDFADFFSRLPHNFLKFTLRGGVPVYEFDDGVDRTLLAGNVPWQVDGQLQLNLGPWGLLSSGLGGGSQQATTYNYNHLNWAVAYQLNVIELSEIIYKIFR